MRRRSHARSRPRSTATRDGARRAPCIPKRSCSRVTGSRSTSGRSTCAGSARPRATARTGDPASELEDAAARGLLAHERLEVLELQRVVVRVERDLVPLVGELRGEVEPRRTLVLGSGVGVATEMGVVVLALEVLVRG